MIPNVCRKKDFREETAKPGWIQEPLTAAEQLRHEPGPIFSKIMRMSAQDSQLQAKSRSYRANYRRHVCGEPPNQKHPKIVPIWGFCGSTEKGLIQKRPDVHKIVLSIKLPSPPPQKKCHFEGFLLICTVFPDFGPFQGGGLTKFCGQEFYGHPDFSDL